ncbi:RICIN domain-containing protein [Marinobacter caseinilyticus]|uniref:RICIN domain-containing protein n=1 Tax=Marinobacter caseinilyticus TaxID=2692195 RepID=UPI00140C5E85|nr:RICIN domain-containing protein [Marinobacter caseinilyticus]
MSIRSALSVLAALAMTLLAGQALSQTGVEQLSEVTKNETCTTCTGDASALYNALNPESERFYYFYNAFLGEGKVLTLDGNNRLMMAAKNSNHTNTRQQWKIVIANDGYVHLWNKALGDTLRVDSDTAKPHMAGSGGYSGQFWYMEDAHSGWSRISNSYQGRNKVLDTYNAAGNYVFLEAKAKNTSGTFWKFSLVPSQ